MDFSGIFQLIVFVAFLVCSMLPRVITYNGYKMGMYVRTYVRTYVCMHACMHACMFVCICVCMCVYMYIYIYIYIHMYARMHACMYVCMYVRTYVCMYGNLGLNVDCDASLTWRQWGFNGVSLGLDLTGL